MHQRFSSYALFLPIRFIEIRIAPMEEEEAPLKIIELSDFLRFPSVLSERFQFKQTKSEDTWPNNQITDVQHSNSEDQQTGIVLLKQRTISTGNYNQRNSIKQKKLVVPNDIIVFADDVDRKKLGLFNRSSRYFSRLVQKIE